MIRIAASVKKTDFDVKKMYINTQMCITCARATGNALPHYVYVCFYV